MADARLDAIARGCRVQIIRMLTHAGSGHPGGSLSVIDLLVAIAFGRLRHDPRRPDWPERDRIVLSKGSEDALITLRKRGSPLQAIPTASRCPASRPRRTRWGTRWLGSGLVCNH